MKSVRMTLSLALACVVSGCSGASQSTTSPTPPPISPPTLTKPAADSPAHDAQLDNVRPTLTVVNGTSNQTGVKTYEFEVSDNSEFKAAANGNAPFASTFSSPSVTEDSSGKTNFTAVEDLQPTTRYYWHARLVQGTSK